MTGSEILAFFEYVKEAAPVVAELVRPIICAFWQCHVTAPLPPSLADAFATIDAKHDAVRAAKRKPAP